MGLFSPLYSVYCRWETSVWKITFKVLEGDNQHRHVFTLRWKWSRWRRERDNRRFFCWCKRMTIRGFTRARVPFKCCQSFRRIRAQSRGFPGILPLSQKASAKLCFPAFFISSCPVFFVVAKLGFENRHRNKHPFHRLLLIEGIFITTFFYETKQNTSRGQASRQAVLSLSPCRDRHQ